jgi:CelD/BcsL family acetyltransferase involved in cellulose biosynthesis
MQRWLVPKEPKKPMPPSLPIAGLVRRAVRSVDIAEGADAVSRTASAWLALTEHGSQGTPFQSYTVAHACSAAHIRRGERPRIVTVRRDGEVVLLLPTVVTSLFGLPVVRFLGDPLIQYGDILARRDLEPEDFAAAWQAATDPSVACFALFRRIRDDAKVAAFLPAAATQTNLQESPLVDLTRGSTLSSRDTRELRRQRRRLEEHGSVSMRLVKGPEARPLLQEALRLKRAWLQTQGQVSAVVGDSTWDCAARVLR